MGRAAESAAQGEEGRILLAGDVGKAFLMAVFVIGTLLGSLGFPLIARIFKAF